jgi:hypothetical protein
MSSYLLIMLLLIALPPTMLRKCKQTTKRARRLYSRRNAEKWHLPKAVAFRSAANALTPSWRPTTRCSSFDRPSKSQLLLSSPSLWSPVNPLAVKYFLFKPFDTATPSHFHLKFEQSRRKGEFAPPAAEYGLWQLLAS